MTEHVPAAAEGTPRARRIGQGHGPSYDIANLASLITVCAVALDGSSEWCDEVANSIRQDVKHTLEWAALIAIDINIRVERLEDGRAS